MNQIIYRSAHAAAARACWGRRRRFGEADGVCRLDQVGCGKRDFRRLDVECNMNDIALGRFGVKTGFIGNGSRRRGSR